MNMNELLAQYKHLIDFTDRMQKSNYKFVEGYISFQKRKKRSNWEQDCIDFLRDATTIQNELLSYIRSKKNV